MVDVQWLVGVLLDGGAGGGRVVVGGNNDFSDNLPVAFSFLLFLTRVGSVLIILNISDLEVFQPQKIFIFGWIGPLDKKSQIQLARPFASNRFCILRERSSAPIHLRNFMLLTSIRQYGRPFGNNLFDLLRCELCLRKNCVLLR